MVLQTPDDDLTRHDPRDGAPGLTAAQAALRLREEGPNTLPGDTRRTLFAILGEVLREPMFVLLLAAGSLYLLLGDRQEGLILFGLVFVVMALMLYQEGKTEHAMAALRDLSTPHARVLRDGQSLRIAAGDVVCGDLLIMAEGDRIAADVVLISASEVQVDESILTGEAGPVEKQAVPLSGDARASRLFSGTLLVKGHGIGRVTATGARSEIGRIGAALATLSSGPSPLKKQTARLVKNLTVIAFGASVFMVLAYGLIRGDWLGALLAGIALAMALLPQEFTVILTVLPALGAWRLTQENVLTRRIAAIETLGATTVLCVDKTGTLTENRMTVVQLYTHTESLVVDEKVTTSLPEVFHTLVEFSILASMVDPFDPMEKAFHRLGQHFLAHTEHLHRDWTLMREYGLTPELRAMSYVWRAMEGGAHVVAAKGAPEAVVDLCHLDPPAQARIAQAVQAMAAQGLRVLAVAQARFSGNNWPPIEHDFDFEFVGLLGLADPLRTEVPDAVAQCQTAGIRIVMITGDHPTTALAIARDAQLGTGAVLTGEAMARMSDTELQRCIQTVSICARIGPEQKLRIVQAFKANGEIVAMTGDGVNDAPALRAAHVGVAMGRRGTDVAREAASVVLLEDNFAALVAAVRLGRRIFDNLRKSMSYVLAVHVPIAGVALLPVLWGWPTLLFPLHIAFLELVINPACSMVFENEPSERDVMLRPPRQAQAPLLDCKTMASALCQGISVLSVLIGAYLWGAMRLSQEEVRAFVFVTLVVGNLALIFSNRSQSSSFWLLLHTPNRTLWGVTSLTLVLLLLALYTPGVAPLFFFDPLQWPDLMLAVALGLVSGLGFGWIKSICHA